MQSFQWTEGQTVTLSGVICNRKRPLGRELGAGLEAKVFELSATEVAKMFFRSSKMRGAKLRVISNLAKKGGVLERVAVPETSILHAGECVGYTMKKIWKTLAETALVPRVAQELGWGFDVRLQLSFDIAKGVAALKSRRIAALDLNGRNVMVSGSHEPRATLIDIDSAAVGPFVCGTATEDYRSPRLISVRGTTANEQDTAFSLAVLIFQLLVGTHPFAQKGGAERTEEDVCARRFGFPLGGSPDRTPNPYIAGRWQALPLPMRTAFQAAFTGPESSRPSAADWMKLVAQCHRRWQASCARALTA